MKAGILGRCFGAEQLVKPEERLGQMPDTRTLYKKLFVMAGPSVVEMVFTSLIGSIDTMMVGTLGSTAIAAVGLVGQPWLILMAMIFGINTGLTAVVARRKGEDRREDAGATLRITLVVAAIVSVLLAMLGSIFARPFVKLAGANSDTLDLAEEYLRIRLLAFPINALTICVNGAQRGTGNTKITLYTNVVANLVNICFNYMLIGGHLGCPALGTAGAAWATDIGMAAGLVLALAATFRKSSYFSLRPQKEDARKIGEILRPITKVSSSALLEQLCIRLGFLLFSRMIADLGTVDYAAHQIDIQFLNLSFCAADGIGVAGTALVGFYLGQRRPDNAKLFGRAAQRVAIAAGLLIAAVFAIFKYPLIRLFTDEAEVIEKATVVMYIVAIFQPIQMPTIVTLGALRGAGDTKFVARVTLLCITFIRPITCAAAIYLFHWGLIGAWIASLTEIAVRLVMGTIRFYGGKWTKIKV